MRGRGRGRGRGWGNRGHHGRHNRGPHPSDSSATERPPPLTQPSREGDPLGALASCDHDSDKDDPAAESKSGSLIVAPKQMSSALGSLMANYGSQTDSESDAEPETTPILRARDLVQENKVLLNTITPNSDDGAPSRGLETFSQGAETEKVSQSDCANYTPHNKRGRWGRGGRGGRRGRGGNQDTPQMRRATLLEMLLAPDIRHERNVLLQCVRYVVRNNFFGLESKKRPGEIKDKAAADIPDGEQKRRKVNTSEEVLVASPVCREKSSAKVSHQEDLETSNKWSQNIQDQGLQNDIVCTEPSKDYEDAAGSSERTAEDFIQNAEETTTKDCHSMNVSNTDTISIKTASGDEGPEALLACRGMSRPRECNGETRPSSRPYSLIRVKVKV